MNNNNDKLIQGKNIKIGTYFRFYDFWLLTKEFKSNVTVWMGCWKTNLTENSC